MEYCTRVYELRRGMHKKAWMKPGMYAVEMGRVQDGKLTLLSLWAEPTEDRARMYADAYIAAVRENGGHHVEAMSTAYHAVRG